MSILESGGEKFRQTISHSFVDGHFIRDAFKAVPWVRSAARFLERAIYYRRCYYVCKFENVLPEQAEEELKKSGFRARLGSETDLTRLAHMETWRSCELYRKWLNAGKQLLLLEKDDDIMSYLWLDFSGEFVIEQVPEMRFRIASDTYVGDEAYTPVAYRGLGFRRLLFIAELLLAQKKGYRFHITYFLNERARAGAFRNFIRTGNAPGKIIMEIHLLQTAAFRFVWHRELLKDETLVRI